LINPDCDIVRQEIYDYLNTRPRLQTDDNGNITVIGGLRRVKPTDTPTVQAPAPVFAPVLPPAAPAPSPAKP
jgi:hypothetical protein